MKKFEIIDWLIKTDNNGHENSCVKIKNLPGFYRPRAETLVFKENLIFLLLTDTGYKIPGGNINLGEDPSKAASRELNEEALITSKNFIKCDESFNTDVSPWVKENVPKENQWSGYLTEIYTCHYTGKYLGYVKEIDRDDIMAKYGKFYPIRDILHILSPEHFRIVEKYLGNYEKNQLYN